MEDGVVMQLYWDCQELRTQLETATAPADREKLIQQSIKVTSTVAVLGLPGAKDTAGGGNISGRQRKSSSSSS
jgi:hypothetical protein